MILYDESQNFRYQKLWTKIIRNISVIIVRGEVQKKPGAVTKNTHLPGDVSQNIIRSLNPYICRDWRVLHVWSMGITLMLPFKVVVFRTKKKTIIFFVPKLLTSFLSSLCFIYKHVITEITSYCKATVKSSFTLIYQIRSERVKFVP